MRQKDSQHELIPKTEINQTLLPKNIIHNSIS